MSVKNRANTPEQKQEIINRLLKVWERCPELRLSQLIINVFPEDFYYKEDYPFVEMLEDFYD